MPRCYHPIWEFCSDTKRILLNLARLIVTYVFRRGKKNCFGIMLPKYLVGFGDHLIEVYINVCDFVEKGKCQPYPMTSCLT